MSFPALYGHSAAPVPSPLIATLMVVAAAMAYGTVPFFVKPLTAAGLASHSIAFYRYIFAAIVLLPFMFAARAQWRAIAWGLFAGAAMGLGWIGYVSSLERVPVSTVGVIYMTYPVFTLLIGWMWFGDQPARRGIGAAFLVVAAAILATPPAFFGLDDLLIVLFSLTAPAGFGLGINILVHKLAPLPVLARLASVSFGAAFGLLPLLLLTSPEAAIPQDLSDLWFIAGIAVVTALVPQLLYSIGAPIIGAARAAVAGSVELPTMFVVAWFAFGESISTAAWIACAIIVLAIVMTPSRATRNVATSLTVPGPR